MSAAGPPITDDASPVAPADARAEAADGAAAEVARPTLTIAVTPVLSYALAYNRIAVVHRVDINNPGPDVGAATLRIQVEDGSGPLGAATDFLVDLRSGGSTALGEPSVWLDPEAMARIDEHRPGAVRVSLLVDGSVLAERLEPVHILAARQWRAVPELLGLEMLAAFVMPHHPSINGLLAEAVPLLQQNTGNPAMQGYQSGSARVDEIVRSIFQAMQARQISYVTAPDSWTDTGHLIRDPAEVLDGRQGTSLDTTVVLAAALEQAGLRPLVFVVHGHAFLGYWRDERSLAGPAQTDVADIVNLIDLDLIRLIETTTVTVTDPPWTFEASHRPPYTTFLTGNLDTVHGVVDIRQSRIDRIVPLPAQVLAADGTVRVIPYTPVDRRGPTPTVGFSSAPSTGETAGAAPPRIEQWKNALLDLSLRNKLINFHRRGSIGLTVPDGLLGAVEDRVHEPSGIVLLAGDQVGAVAAERGVQFGRDLPADQLAELFTARGSLFTDVTASTYDSRLRAMAYKAKTVIEETGANNLYLALGSLLWKLDDRELRSPLVLVPVRLITRTRQRSYRIEIDESGASTPNFCLLEKLRLVHGLHVPGLAQPAEDGAGIDLDSALQAMRAALADAGLPFRVEDSAELAVLQFAKFRLWKDLADHWPDLIANPLVQHLVSSPFEPFVDPVAPQNGVDLDELAASCPVPADASQVAAVGEATAGRTFVLEGPPGTGKSQTITNLLARAIADGRRVLFVAEKRAALDVVTRRLEAIGLGPFCLDLHDKSSKPTVVRSQIRAALDHQVAVDAQGLAATAEDLRASRGQLARYATRLHEPNGAGLSFYSARTAVLSIGKGTEALPIPAPLLDVSASETLNGLRRTLTTVGDVAAAANPRPDHPWAFVDSPGVDASAVHAGAVEFDAAVAELPRDGVLADALGAVCEPTDLSALVAMIDRSGVAVAVLDETRSARWHQATDALTAQLAAFTAATHPGRDLATPAAIELPLADLYAQAQAAAESSWFGRKKRLIAVRDQLAGVLLPGAEIEPAEVPDLVAALLQVQGEARGLAARTAAIPGVFVPAGWNPLTDQGRDQVDRQITWLRWAGAAVDPSVSPSGFTQALRNWVEAAQPVAARDRQAVIRADVALRALLSACSVSGAVLGRWAGVRGILDRWRGTATARALADPNAASLRRWLAFVAALEPLRTAGAKDARAMLLSGLVPADDAVRAFDAGVAAASTAERRDATGLAGFDTVTHGRQISRFTASANDIRDLLTTAIPRQVLDRRTFDAASGLGQVGELQRELAKQRRGLQVRGLLARYGELITAIMPCMLVSPDSLARFFPPRPGLFDLVVFDEASQIRVADAVGAMGRGRSVVVVGDSKQMPPTSFAELNLSGGDSDDESSAGGDLGLAEDAVAEVLPAEDEESILSECVQARVPQRWLSWHYRSQDESLIAFSNRQYYAGGLSSFPAPHAGLPDSGIDGHGISLVRVDGTFHRSGAGKLLRTNPIEAQAVIDEIKSRFAADPAGTPSIGVVTFNIQQRTLIESMLRDSGDERLIEALDGPADTAAAADHAATQTADHEGLFVKNLENVQGDERDVILFSTAFSVNSRGSLPLNFGPLNRAGGERRLNVAITRARRQVIVFSSFEPAQLRAEETSSVGVKHLRAYLDLAQQGPRALGPLPAGRRLRITDRHREDIAEALRQRGFAVRTEVGLSDFTIDLVVAPGSDPGHDTGGTDSGGDTGGSDPVLAVLLDGPGWAARRTVGDRDGLPVEVLSKLMHWPAVQRVWLPEWLVDRDVVLDRLSDVVRDAVDAVTAKRAAAAGRTAQAARAETPPTVTPPVAAPMPAAPDWPVGANDQPVGVADPSEQNALPLRTGETVFAPWVPGVLGPKEVLDELPAPESAQRVYAAMISAIEAEGPIQLDRLIRLVAAGFGLHRVVAARHAALLAVLPAGLCTDQAAPEFVWPPSLNPLTWQGFRSTPEGVDRSLEHISPREIGNAMVALCGAAAGMTEDQLWAGTLEVFGFSRRSASQVSRLDAALGLVLASGRLSRRSDGVLISSAM